MQYELEHWVREEWLTDSRYYLLELKQDIFGVWQCFRQWRGIDQKGGRSASSFFESYSDAVIEVEKLRELRRKRGYWLCVV